MRAVFCLALVVAAGVVCGDEERDARATVEEVVAAVGGEDKLLRIFRMKERYHWGSEPEPAEGKAPGTRESILEAPGHWWVGKKDRTGEPAKFDVWAWTLVALTDAKSRVTVVPDSVEKGKAVFGLRVSGSIEPPLDMYFDEGSKLLVRMDWRNDIYRFSDWREHDGVKYAAKTVISYKDSGTAWFYHEITELERLEEAPGDLPR